MDWSKVSALYREVAQSTLEGRAEVLNASDQIDPSVREYLADQLERETATSFMATSAAIASDDAGQDRILEPDSLVGAWRIDRLIAKGGMGAVYRAVRDDPSFKQVSALKLLYRTGEDFVERLEDERRKLAKLEHPNIARIIDGGTDGDGNPFMAVEYVEGDPIDRWCSARRSSLNAKLRLLQQLCSAITHAHARLLLHRDVKPSNILVNSDGNVRLIDFGIAALIDADESLAPGPLTFTVAAPEQLEGRPVTIATDIFQIGMVAHFLIAGKWPERCADGSVNTKLGRAHSGDLQAVLRKALAMDPADRYQSTEALGNDLANLSLGAPVAARDGGPLYRFGKTITRYKVASAAFGIATFALVGGLGVSLWQTDRALQSQRRALVEEQRTEAIEDSLYLLLAGSESDTGTAQRSQLLADQSQRVRALFQADPAQYAAVLQSLGELQFNLTDYPGAIETLEMLIQERTEIDAHTLAQGKYNLAQAYWNAGEGEKARQFLAEAQAFWMAEPEIWETRLADSRLLEAQTLREGDPDAAMTVLTDALQQSVGRYGPGNQREAVFVNNIGALQFSSGDLEGADQSFSRALEIWRSIGMAGSFDAANTLNNLASIRHMLGRSEDAAELFAEAVVLRDRLYGPSAATAALLNNHGKVLMAVGQDREAIVRLERAESMARTFAGEGSPLHIAATIGHSEALSKLGDPAGMAKARDAKTFVDGLGNPPPLVAVNAVAFARAYAVEGDRSNAIEQLNTAKAIATELGPQGERLLANIQQAETDLASIN